MIEPISCSHHRGYCFDWPRRNQLVAALAVQAPYADQLIISVAAGLLAGSACSDALLIAADAIDDARNHLATRDGNFDNERRSLQVLIDALRLEAPMRATNELFAAP